MTDKLLTEKDLAARWSMAPRTLQMQRRGDYVGPAFIQLGERSVRYSLADVVAYEKARRVGRHTEPEGWRQAMQRAAGALDVLAKSAKTPKAKQTLSSLRDELRTLLA